MVTNTLYLEVYFKKKYIYIFVFTYNGYLQQIFTYKKCGGGGTYIVKIYPIPKLIIIGQLIWAVFLFFF